MNDDILIAIISAVAVAVPSILTTVMTINKTHAVIEERIKNIQSDLEVLSKRVDKQNNLIERVSVLENEVKHIGG